MALALAGVLFALGSWRLVPGVTGVYHDDAIYVITAKALAQGDGYRLINLPGAPPQTKYPILYPLLLAAVWKVQPVFPDTVVLMQYLTLVLGSAGIGLSYLYLVRFRYCDRLAAAGVGLVCATSPEMAYFSTITMAEMPFLVLTLLALWRLEGALVERPAPLSALFTGCLLATPFLCRTVGVAFLLGGLTVLLMRRRPVAWIALGAALPVAAWAVWTLDAWGMFASGNASGYYRDYGGAWLSSAGSSLGSIAGSNAVSLIAATPMSALLGLTQLLEPVGVILVPPLLLLGGLTWAAVAADAAWGRPLACGVLAYGGVITFWPWPPDRFLVPLHPLLVAYLWTVLRSSRNAVRRMPVWRTLSALAWFACIAAVAGNLATARVWATTSREAGYPLTRPPEAPIEWQSFEAVHAWLRARPGRTTLVAGGLDTMLFLYTGHLSVRPFPHRPAALFYGARQPATGTAGELAVFLQDERVRYLVETPMYMFAEEAPFAAVIGELRRTHPRLLKEVYRGQDARFAVYEVQQ